VCVLDSSVAMSWFLEDERDDLALSTAQAVGHEQTLVPSVFPLGVPKRNVDRRSQEKALARRGTQQLAGLYALSNTHRSCGY